VKTPNWKRERNLEKRSKKLLGFVFKMRVPKEREGALIVLKYFEAD